MNEEPEAEEGFPGALVIRIRENLDFANTAQLKGTLLSYKLIQKGYSLGGIERLRRMELYGPVKTHPSEAPRRQQTTVIVFHMADVDKCDAS